MSKFWTSDRIVSTSAILISLLTLVVFIYQTNLIRKQQFRSVYPHLMIGNGGTGTLDYIYVLSNEGIGPALLSSIEVEGPDGQKFSSLYDYLDTQLTEEDSIWIHNTDIYPGMLIPAGEQLILFGLWNEKQSQSLGLPPNTLKGSHKLWAALNHDDLNIKISYKSIYEESWYITNNSVAPVLE